MDYSYCNNFVPTDSHSVYHRHYHDSDIEIVMSCPMDAACCDLGFVASYSADRSFTFPTGNLLIWQPDRLTRSASKPLSVDTADLLLPIPGDYVSGLTMKAIRMEDSSWLCAIISWSSAQLATYNILCPESGPIFLESQYDCAITRSPLLIVINEDASKSASIERKTIIIRGEDLRRIQIVRCPDYESSSLVAVSFCGISSDDILFSLEDGTVYVSTMH